jgi:hypothetical protein
VSAAPDTGPAAPTAADLVNPYWDAVARYAIPSHFEDEPPQVGQMPNDLLDVLHDPDPDTGLPGWLGGYVQRDKLTARYAWTITDPPTVEFVAAHAGRAVLDPLAGSGYWAWLLGQLGIDVHASDLVPPSTGQHYWHQSEHVPVWGADAVEATAEYGADRTLLLSWPPTGPLAGQILAAYTGPTVIYIGEFGNLGTSADHEFFQTLMGRWHLAGRHLPVQWHGMHDLVAVFHRDDPDDPDAERTAAHHGRTSEEGQTVSRGHRHGTRRRGDRGRVGARPRRRVPGPVSHDVWPDRHVGP